jgi:thiamine biosynthesis protein ThiI
MVEHLEKGRMLAFRRYMFRVAEHVAEATDAVGIVTGEAIGQKSSQTTQNLAVTSAATNLPIHRPLVTTDKTDITGRAREIGTFTDSTLPAGCNRIAPDQAETNAIVSRQREIEPDALFDWAERDASAVEIVPPR